jgi:hypothetical protein
MMGICWQKTPRFRRSLGMVLIVFGGQSLLFVAPVVTPSALWPNCYRPSLMVENPG